MNTILGAGGSIGIELAKALASYSAPIRLVSRNPKKVNPSDTLMTCNLLDAKQTEDAIKGSTVVYLTVGLPYKTSVWQESWPLVMKNVIDGCKKHRSKLVFFDNVYMYGWVEGKMSEDTPFNPCSKKGEVRAKIATMILDEIKAGNLTALIARSADFFGPNVQNSLLQSMVIDNFKRGKPAQWFCNAEVKHVFTFTPDAAVATALLGNTPSAFQQTWHLPSPEPISGKALINIYSKVMQAQPKITIIGPTMTSLLGFFIPILKEFKEMLYQYEHDYLFDSTKFKQSFSFQPVTYEDGVRLSLKNS
ncbi:MAG: NAD-dependent epimerase/dehydratase family protein [Chloroherpetonaceae bacterium]|nr:NAD-dependent epimerase/dehydratase family protein [Chloroherpetonaceae bacterium]